jgi:signal transduction histidine kinase
VIIDSRSFIDENRKIEMIFRPASNEPVVVEADKSKVFEVLSNIIRNAIKFTKEGTITIISGVIDGAAVVKVKDTGSGIDPEIMPKLFTRFASKSESGTGLGLFIAKNIVEAHGGKIWAENNSDGRGATFAFSLPLAKIEEKEFTK